MNMSQAARARLVFRAMALLLLMAPGLGSASIRDDQDSCVRPHNGYPEGACAALSDEANSTHAGDVWTACEAADDEVNYSGAVFYAGDALSYWDAEMNAYMLDLRHELPRHEYARVLQQHRSWTKRRDGIERGLLSNIEEEGTSGMFLRSRAVAHVAREEALVVGCKLETSRSAKSH